LIQTSRGKAALLESATGKTIQEKNTEGPAAWPQAPLLISEHQACMVHDTRNVVLLDLATGQEVWRYAIERRTSLSGAAPQLLVKGTNVLIGVPRNYGYEIERLDAATGKGSWPRPILLRGDRLEFSRAALDEMTLYVATGSRLVAF